MKKVGPADYKCEYCGTIHKLEIDDTETVEALVEQNSLRWLKINKQMDRFFDMVNHAAAMKEALRRPWKGLIIVNVFFLILLLVLGKAFLDFAERTTRAIVMKDFLPLFVIGGIATVINLYYYIQIFIGRRRLSERLNKAQAVLKEVIDTYRQMLKKPAEEIISRLHDSKKIMNKRAANLAHEIYGRIFREENPDLGGEAVDGGKRARPSSSVQ